MNNAAPSPKQLNRTLIGSVLFIDIVGYSTRTVPDQLQMKDRFNRMLAEAVRNVAPADRIMVDTGDGAGIAFLGDPEDALFAMLSLDDASAGEPGFLRMGINVGPLKVVQDINGHTNMIGDGVNDAQRVMSFADPGQVMVSHSYYDIVSRLSRDYAQLFAYEGTRHDKHARAHAVYRFEATAEDASLSAKLRERAHARRTDAMPPSRTQRPGIGPVMAKLPATLASRAGMLALMLGTGSLVGAVWSGTDAPEPAAAAAPISPPLVRQNTPEAGLAAATPAAPASTGSAEAPPAPVRTVKKPAATPDRTVEKTARPADSAAPAGKPGTVRLAIRPWGEVYINGNKRGVSPPLQSLSLPPGTYRIEIRNGEFAPHKETIEVASGRQATVRTVF